MISVDVLASYLLVRYYETKADIWAKYHESNIRLINKIWLIKIIEKNLVRYDKLNSLEKKNQERIIQSKVKIQST